MLSCITEENIESTASPSSCYSTITYYFLNLKYVNLYLRLHCSDHLSQDIKSYGCHENVLSIRLGGPSVGLKEVHFKLKEAVVVRELMDQASAIFINFWWHFEGKIKFTRTTPFCSTYNLTAAISIELMLCGSPIFFGIYISIGNNLKIWI